MIRAMSPRFIRRRDHDIVVIAQDHYVGPLLATVVATYSHVVLVSLSRSFNNTMKIYILGRSSLHLHIMGWE